MAISSNHCKRSLCILCGVVGGTSLEVVVLGTWLSGQSACQHSMQETLGFIPTTYIQALGSKEKQKFKASLGYLGPCLALWF